MSTSKYVETHKSTLDRVINVNTEIRRRSLNGQISPVVQFSEIELIQTVFIKNLLQLLLGTFDLLVKI